jgi:hypothetical protein
MWSESLAGLSIFSRPSNASKACLYVEVSYEEVSRNSACSFRFLLCFYHFLLIFECYKKAVLDIEVSFTVNPFYCEFLLDCSPFMKLCSLSAFSMAQEEVR